MAKDECVKLVSLESSSAEYKKVEGDFMSTAGKLVPSITKIERVQNPIVYRQYMLRKEELTKRSTQQTDIERRLWHGTSNEAIMSINREGFNRSYCGKNATLYGEGVYFAVNSEYAGKKKYSVPDANGLKYVYQARVLTGAYTKGDPNCRVAPYNPAIPNSRVNSVVNDVSAPSIFVILLDNQAYPEYLITFSAKSKK